MLAAVAQMLHELGPERRLQSLTLGYSWFSEASDETLHELQVTWFTKSLRDVFFGEIFGSQVVEE
jgi:hypothetical protein